VPFPTLVLAQATDPKMTLLFIGALFAIMYFVMIRPQQKQMKLQRDMLTQLKKGDEVITQAGIVGKIHAVTEKFVQLEIANGVKVRFLKSAISQKVTGVEEEEKKASTSEDKKEDSKEAK
jgi:preprotein translocase subunit YajC